MENRRREVYWLESFPPDIWAYFARYIPGEQLGRLMMTGATLLWQRLKSPTVIKSIKLGTDFIVFESFPKFLNEFESLDELTIHSCCQDWSEKLRLSIDLIPSGVRKLELSGEWSISVAESLLYKDCVFHNPPLKLSEHLPHIKILDLIPLKFHHFDWLTYLPPSLTQLSLCHWDGTVELPHSLIHFKASYVSASSTPSFVSKLPPLMESFVVWYGVEGDELILPLLPPTLHKIWLPHSLHTSTEKFLEQLPQSLTFLRAHLSFGTSPESALSFPSTLTELNLPKGVPCSAWCLLPRCITSLTLGAPSSSEVPESIPFETLPKSVTKLELCSSGPTSYLSGPPVLSDQSTYFPPNLTYLCIPDDIQLSPETTKLFPSSLTYLEMVNLCARVCEHLPNGLKTLISSRTLMSPGLINFLPKSLTFLQLDFRIGDNSLFDYNTRERIGPTSVHPDYSIHKILLGNTDWEDSSLGMALQYFVLRGAVGLGDSFLLHQQVPNMLQLSLDQSNNFTDFCIPLLSPHLTSLNLASSHMISSRSFGSLPRCLTHLNLNSSTSIFDSDIQHLPRTLKCAYLKSAIHLTDICVPDLPPRMERLSLRKNSQISKYSFSSFPSTLRSCQLSDAVQLSGWTIDCGAVLEHISYDWEE